MIRPARRHLLVAAACTWLLALGLWLLYAHSTELIDSYAKCTDQGYPVTDTNPAICLADGRAFLGPRQAPAPTSADVPVGTAQPFDILVDGDSGGTYPARQEVITTDTAWSNYWHTIHAGHTPMPPLLPVNFTTNQVVALSEGPKSTGGYNLKITSITSGPKGTVVNVTESVPTITCAVTESLSNRYFIVKTPKLAPPVSFRITTEPHRCQ